MGVFGADLSARVAGEKRSVIGLNAPCETPLHFFRLEWLHTAPQLSLTELRQANIVLKLKRLSLIFSPEEKKQNTLQIKIKKDNK